jgi:hypothetical protein
MLLALGAPRATISVRPAAGAASARPQRPRPVSLRALGWEPATAFDELVWDLLETVRDPQQWLL